MSIIPNFYLNSVVSIGILPNPANVNNITWIGTGFFVGRSIEGQEGQVVPFLVSNKHVFKGNNAVVIRMKKKDSEELEVLNVTLKNADGSLNYTVHEMADVDIAVLQLSAQVINDHNLNFCCFDIDNLSMTSEELRKNGADVGTIIYMLGYPLGLVNVSSNLPVCRMGCISRMSETQLKEQHNILVDIQNFPGNSGSPIIIRPETTHLEGTPVLGKSVLAGIVHEYFPYRETLINSQTKEIVEIRSENSGLANVHPVEYIRDIIDKIYPKPKQAAEQTLQTQPAQQAEPEA